MQLVAKIWDVIRRRFVVVMGVVLVLLLVASGVLGWIASSKIIAVTNQKIEYDQTVVSVSGSSYTFSGSAYNVQGVIGGIRSDGSMIGIFGAPTGINAATKTSVRTLESLTGPQPTNGEKVSLQGNIWTSNPKDALGLSYEDVKYPGPLGDMSAWLIKGSNGAVWTIGVHGIGADKTEMLRFIKPVYTAGNTMMVINYRNDLTSPVSPDGRNNLGNTEWQDLEAAVKYAQSQGASKVNLYGDSLGGSIVENYLRRGSNANLVDRVVLDSPALDWGQILRNRAKSSGYPTVVYYPTSLVLQLRTGINLRRISTHAADIKNKTLIIHSSNDQNVPQAASKKLAADRPDMVTLVDFGEGGHLRSWNYDSKRYENTVADFLR